MTDIVDRLNTGAPSIPAMRDGAEEIMKLRREREALRYQLTVAETRGEIAVRHLVGIHSLMLPADAEINGKTFRFIPPDHPVYRDAYRALCERIRVIPEVIARAEKADSPVRRDSL